MPGLRKSQLVSRLGAHLEGSGCQLKPVEFLGAREDLPCRLQVTFPNRAERRFNLYCWTIGHGGRTRSATEYRIQAKLKEQRRLNFGGATAVLLGYYEPLVDTVGKELGNEPPEDMRVIACWNPVYHLHVGASSSCQVSFGTLQDAYLAGAADTQRKCAHGELETVVVFRPELLARYMFLAGNGREQLSAQDLLTFSF
jgi:hypothetical protein